MFSETVRTCPFTGYSARRTGIIYIGLNQGLNYEFQEPDGSKGMEQIPVSIQVNNKRIRSFIF